MYSHRLNSYHSPKGTIKVLNANRSFFCDLGSLNSRKNLQKKPFIEINKVDIIS